ncbi:hypothetical protein ACIRUL_14990 [Streptomyces sp. NPDC101171]|uniref:hypothetical protein n=1 Tax=Streptomyces sp. NPDC101171 TaxID=3366122 RepID=UPI003813415F
MTRSTMLCAFEAVGTHHAGDSAGLLPLAASLVAASLVALATMAGAWAARRVPGPTVLVPAAASGILLVIAVLDLLPDAWDEAAEAGLPPWAVPLTALASFALMGALARTGCPCGRERAGGIGAAAGLAVHRFVEGTALALTTSPAVIAALLVHAAGEGLALAALLAAQPGRRTACWLALACLSPLAGVLVTSAVPLPDGLLPFLLAAVAGVLGQAARVALGLARRQRPAGRRVRTVPISAAVTLAAVATVLSLLIAAGR